MTNTLLGVLITGARKKMMGIQFKQSSCQLEALNESQKTNMSKALHPFSRGKRAQSLHGKAEGQRSAASQTYWDITAARLRRKSPDTVPRKEGNGSWGTPVTCSSSHTAGQLFWLGSPVQTQEGTGCAVSYTDCSPLPRLLIIPFAAHSHFRLHLGNQSCPKQAHMQWTHCQCNSEACT